jgi:hypothetical protein
MRQSLLIILFSGLALLCLGQTGKRIQKAWIKTSIENLSPNLPAPDTIYTRYTFDMSKLYISFYPGWDDYQLEWSANKDNIKIGFDVYHIEELTDTSLIIKAEGFRKMTFLSEDFLASQDEYLDSIGIFEGKPLYKANKFISPRYLKGQPLSPVLQKNTDGYNIKRAMQFQMKFVVTEKGEIKNIEVIKGITYGFDNEVKEQLQKTSKRWTPARYKSNSIQTEMYYDIKFLDSIVR